jgi:hypothetical protein
MTKRNLSALTDDRNLVVMFQMKVSVLIGDLNLVVICHGNPETKKNINVAGRLSFGKYKKE